MECNRELCLCINYWELNKAMVADTYPMPNVTDLLDQLAQSCMFTKIDLCLAYQLVQVQAGNEYKTAFYSTNRLYKSLTMPFGLVNAPATFQQVVNRVFEDMLGINMVVYLTRS